MGEASQYEKRCQLLIATHQCENYVKAATERSQKSRSEKELRLLEKGRVELLRDYISEQSKTRKLRHDKERKKEDGAWKRMATAGNVAIATSAGEERRKKKKKRELQRHATARVACSSAVNQLEQASKDASVEAKEENCPS